VGSELFHPDERSYGLADIRTDGQWWRS